MELKNFFAQDLAGNILPSPAAYLYLPGTTTTVSGLKDKDGAALSNPFTGTAQGLVQLAAPDGDYDLRLVGSGRDYTIRVRFIDAVTAISNTNDTALLTGGIDPRMLRIWRDGLARRGMGLPGQFATLAMLTDSRGSGYMGGFVSTNNALKSWPIELAKRMQQDTGISISYDAWWGASRIVNTVGETLDSRIVNNGFQPHAFKGPGGAMFTSTAAGQTISFTTSQTVDTIDLVYYGNGGGQFQVSVDGGTTPLKMTRVARNPGWIDGGRGEVPYVSSEFTATISGNVMTVTSMTSGSLSAGKDVRRVVTDSMKGISSTEYGTIQAFGTGGTTGTGGVGTYSLSASSTVSSGVAMTSHSPSTTMTCNFGSGGDGGISLLRVRVMAAGTTLGFADSNFGAAGVKTITIKALSSGVIFPGLAAYNQAVPQIRVHPLPWVGATTKDWATNAQALQWFNVIQPDLTIVDLTTNDMYGNLGQASNEAGQALASGYFDTILGSPGSSGIRQYGEAMMVVPYDLNTATVSADRQVSWQNFIRKYANTKGVPIYDMQKRMGSFAANDLAWGSKGTKPGWYADGIHMWWPGHQDYAAGIARALNWI